MILMLLGVSSPRSVPTLPQAALTEIDTKNIKPFRVQQEEAYQESEDALADLIRAEEGYRETKSAKLILEDSAARSAVSQ